MNGICWAWRSWNASSADTSAWNGGCGNPSCLWRRRWSILIDADCPARSSSNWPPCWRGRLWIAGRTDCFFGNPGSGKTHLAAALGQELIRQGRRVYFAPCSLLVQDLLIAKRDLHLSRVLKKLARYEVLIIDDLGYVEQSRQEMEVLFTLLAERYERGSVLITSNLPFSKWERIFKDPMTTAAAIDRLVHHSVIVELNLPSYRMEAAKQAKLAKPRSTKNE